MSVLQRKELEDSPLADLHAIASELGIEGYRALRRDDLIASVLDIQGGGEAAEEGAAAAAPEADAPRRGRSRGRRGRVRSRGEIEDRPEAERPEGEVDDEPEAEAEEARGAADGDAERETVAGVLDVLPNGSGFLRVSGGSDVYVSPAQIRRCELRPGDEVAGPLRPARRNERYPSLVRVETVNGGPAESPAERQRFDSLTPVHPHERLAAPESLAGAPFGKGSRVAIAGPSGAGATRLLREIVAVLSSQSDGPSLTVVLAGARPEEVTDWKREAGRAAVHGGSFDSSPEDQAQAATLAVERAKRVVEGGGDAVVVIDTLEAVPAGVARQVFGAGRRVEEGGSLTVIAAVGEALDQLRLASTRVVLAGGASEPTLVAERSGAQRADLLS